MKNLFKLSAFILLMSGVSDGFAQSKDFNVALANCGWQMDEAKGGWAYFRLAGSDLPSIAGLIVKLITPVGKEYVVKGQPISGNGNTAEFIAKFSDPGVGSFFDIFIEVSFKTGDSKYVVKQFHFHTKSE